MEGSAIEIPERWASPLNVDDNWAKQLLASAWTGVLKSGNEGWRLEARDGTAIPLFGPGTTPEGVTALEVASEAFAHLPATPDSNDLSWRGPSPLTDTADVLESLAGRFLLKQADGASDGLRVPQAGAVHAVLAHWTTMSLDPVTVVLPTGTGKTETMLALFADQQPNRLLVVVPSVKLRAQIAKKFETFGVLPAIGVVTAGALRPVVGRIEHHFSSSASMRSFVERCNVLVTTPDALQASSSTVVEALIRRCSHLFVDEAHHVPTKSWSKIRDAFADKRVVQFTATPFREDGKKLGGRVVYSYPLGEAQRLGYFEKIDYVSVVALSNPDQVVAETALARLRHDLAEGRDHLIMARVNRIGRARDEVLPIYEELAADLSPVILHSDLSAPERKHAMEAIEQRRSRVIICVNMLGEGFDFPQLKIAAIHDPHRSLGVALQFIGRFARSEPGLGRATAVVSRPSPGFDPRLQELYAERNNWDAVLNVLSGSAIEDVEEEDEFDAGFTEASTGDISVQLLRPKMSTVVYRTHCDAWRPERLPTVFDPETIVGDPSFNLAARVGWIVIERRSGVRWADLKSVEDTVHHLHLLHWDEERSLLYVNSSDLGSLHENLAATVCGEDVERVSGQTVYRVLADIDRPIPTTVGVIDLRNHSRRFSMHVGADVYDGFPVAEQQTKSNTNIFVAGYSGGERVTMGAAAKGRIWSQRAARSISDWVNWCLPLGPKLLDDTLNLDAIFRSFVRPKPLEDRPPLIPIAMDWQWMAYSGMEEGTRISVGGASCPIIDADLVLGERSETGAIPYAVVSEGFESPYQADIQDGRLVHTALGTEAVVRFARSDPQPLSEYLNTEGCLIWFEQEVLIDGPSLLLEIEREQHPIDLMQLVEVDWSNIDIRKESRGRANPEPNTVQARALERLEGLEDWDVVIDDDGTGEIADLVAFKVSEERFIVHLVHCKFSSQGNPGARVGDLYEVCGQAHRSAHYRTDFEAMVQKLIHRERLRRNRGEDGLVIGSEQDLLSLQEKVRPRLHELRVTVAQPGLSKGGAQDRHLQLLGATDVYVRDVAAGTFDVWCSS